MEYTFKEKVKAILQLLVEPKVLIKLLSLRLTGYLTDVGWFNAFKSGEPVGYNFEPLPWFTYSFIDFLTERLDDNFTVFEFGSGNSTLYFAKRIKFVTSVEHSAEWYNKLISKIPGNVNLLLSKTDSVDDYVGLISVSNNKFDIVFIDGIHRNECSYNTVESLTEKGVIVLDDSERVEYSEGIEYITNKGFKKLNFWGIPPGMLIRKCTTLFYRNNNCLGI